MLMPATVTRHNAFLNYNSLDLVKADFKLEIGLVKENDKYGVDQLGNDGGTEHGMSRDHLSSLLYKELEENVRLHT